MPGIRTPKKKPGEVTYESPGLGNSVAAHGADNLHARRKPPNASNVLRVLDSSFYLDGEDFDLDVVVDPYLLPPPEIAEKLFDCYMQTVHNCFPILPEMFEDQFRNFNDSVKEKRPSQVPDHWLATLNLVLAIGAQYSKLARADWQADERDHLIYITRAIQILRLDKITSSLSGPSLPLIQATGLLSLYYITIGHISRAWIMIGISLRFALATGLHLRNDDPAATANTKESQVRTWWSLHSIESLVCSLIGRPCIIPNDECTVTLPQVLLKEHFPDGPAPQSKGSIRRGNKRIELLGGSSLNTSNRGNMAAVTSASFLGARVTIALIMQEALSKLYSPRISVDSWERMQKEITSMTRDLDEWVVAALPEGLHPATSLQECDLQRERLLLSFHYHSARILICRPCLCRLERRVGGQSRASAEFNRNTADTCVQAARSITRLLPDQPDLAFIYGQGPWWCIVHNIMQAIAVFLLEMSFDGTYRPHDDSEMSKSIKKLVRWLQSLSVNNAVAERAYNIIIDITQTNAAQVRIDISDILAEDETSMHRHHSFQTSPSADTTIPLYSEHSSIHAEPGVPSFDDSTANNNVGTQYHAAFGKQQPTQTIEALQPDLYPMLDPGSHKPSTFSNPFMTNLDHFDWLTNPFYWDIDSGIRVIDSRNGCLSGR